MALTKVKRFVQSHTPDVMISPKTQQKIAELAYRLYEERGRESGHALEDWLEAERRILGTKGRGKR